ncbi:DUF4440 domain-containing protein [Gemmatimonas phototrophica]|uniref:Multidrug ABC transporter n=1 Tax=Gemmatimonas phototrophica TaxID=1379270 RepID=A0A143BPL0_9BACT|nr:DUF4440 domain-containing protein [Gemmatimonas phototrophica]AMW06440.1 multidrug ABC transporter [Gemmatimonas phototrophica]
MHRFPFVREVARLAAGIGVAFTVFANPARAQSTPRSAPPSGPTVTLPPALDKVLRDYEAAWRKGDAAALAALFADDGFVLQTGRAPIRGRAAITAAYTGQGGSPLVLHALAGSVADTVGYIIGTYDYGSAGPAQGKFTLTLRRRAGGPWFIFSDMDNSTRRPE